MSDPIQTLYELRSEMNSLCDRIHENVAKFENSDNSIDRFLHRVFKKLEDRCIAVKSMLDGFEDVLGSVMFGAWGKLALWYAYLYATLRQFYYPLDSADVWFDDSTLLKVENAALASVVNIVTTNAQHIAGRVYGDIVVHEKLERLERYAEIVKNSALYKIYNLLYDAILEAEQGRIAQSMNLVAEAAYIYDAVVFAVDDDYNSIKKLIDSIIAAIPYIYAVSQARK